MTLKSERASSERPIVKDDNVLLKETIWFWDVSSDISNKQHNRTDQYEYIILVPTGQVQCWQGLYQLFEQPFHPKKRNTKILISTNKYTDYFFAWPTNEEGLFLIMNLYIVGLYNLNRNNFFTVLVIRVIMIPSCSNHKSWSLHQLMI